MKIGIIGSENSHAAAFSKILTEMGIEAVVCDTLTPAPDLDGVMIVRRDGKFHKELAMPFIEAKIPVWIDKPITVDPAEAEELFCVASELGVPVTGGSTAKFDPFFLDAAGQIADGSLGEVRSAMMNLSGMPESPYSGIHFYAHHLSEIMLTLFGYEVRSLRAIRHGNNIVCHVHYDKMNVILNFQDDVYRCCLSVLGTKDSLIAKTTLDDGYRYGVKAFVEMIKTGIPPVEYDKLMYPIRLVNAIKQSYEGDKEIVM